MDITIKYVMELCDDLDTHNRIISAIERNQARLDNELPEEELAILYQERSESMRAAEALKLRIRALIAMINAGGTTSEEEGSDEA